MKVPFVDFKKSYAKLRSEMLPAIDRVLGEGNLILREDVEEFEENLAKYVGTRYAVGVNSGTDALYLALRAAGVREGDEVITVSHTFIATIEAIVRVGAKPVLVDIGEDYLMDVAQVASLITDRTRAIIPVHLSGDVCDMAALFLVAAQAEHTIHIIEDSAQALGAKSKESKAGSMGLAGCFSFYPAKLLGGYGDGGAITTNSLKMYEEIKKLRNHYYIGKGTKDDMVKFGVNSRLDNIHAAALNIKLKHIDDYIERRKEIARMYDEGLKSIAHLVLPIERGVYQDYVVRAEDRDELRDFLTKEGVETLGGDIVPNHLYKGLNLDFELPNTEKYTAEFLRLPCNPELENEEVNYVIDRIKLFYE
ncbi:hypothetical protein CMI37_11610 [Candidatus Pacearchaeota archaeon]|nr:hypothetical protein [Candidatus Pacearchaeota archaeon]|tara:strand:- start:3118 stop:4209 length:1092 start_codon:yes stop_codon:yes gene_type:complete